MSIINFIVYSDGKVIFLNSANATGEEKTTNVD